MATSRGALLAAVLAIAACAVPPPAAVTPGAESAPAVRSSGSSPPSASSPRPAASVAAGVTLETTRSADDITLTLSSPVRRGGTATLSATTAPNAVCTVVATYPSAPIGTRGLEAKGADGAGSVSWSWTIGADAPAGEWSVDVGCQLPSGQRTVGRQPLVIE